MATIETKFSPGDRAFILGPQGVPVPIIIDRLQYTEEPTNSRTGITLRGTVYRYKFPGEPDKLDALSGDDATKGPEGEGFFLTKSEAIAAWQKIQAITWQLFCEK